LVLHSQLLKFPRNNGGGHVVWRNKPFLLDLLHKLELVLESFHRHER
jgi:hypothetical protein